MPDGKGGRESLFLKQAIAFDFPRGFAVQASVPVMQLSGKSGNCKVV
jgi:hypothetical protein